MKIFTEYPVIDNGRVLTNASRCGEKCSSDIPFLYQDGEYANVGGKAKSGGGGVHHAGTRPRRGGYLGGVLYPTTLVESPVIVKTKEKAMPKMDMNLKIGLGILGAYWLVLGTIYLTKHFKK